MRILHFFGRASSTLVAVAFFGVGSVHSRPRPHTTVSISSSPKPIVSGPLWNQRGRFFGIGFIPGVIQGKAVSLMVDLQDSGNLSLSSLALHDLGITLSDTTQLDRLTIGGTTRHVPITMLSGKLPASLQPDSVPPVVGVAGMAFVEQYDLVYDLPHFRMTLYARPATRNAKRLVLPKGIAASACAPMRVISHDAGTFTAMDMKLDGHAVVGALEMGRYYPKMNDAALHALALPVGSSRVIPIPSTDLPQGYTHNGYAITQQVTDVAMTVGTHEFWRGTVQLFPVIDVQTLLPNDTPVMLLNLRTLDHAVLFNSPAQRTVCLSEP